MKTGALLFFLLLITSCAQKLPDHQTGYGRIGVSFQVINSTSYRLIRAVELKSSADDEFSIRITQPPLNGEVALSQPVAAGTYLIDQYTTRIVPVPGATDRMQLQTETFPKPVKVNLQDGEILLLPIGFTANQYNKAGYVFCKIGWQEMDSGRLQSYGQELEKRENASMWTITAQ